MKNNQTFMREKHELICGYCQTSPIAYDDEKGELFCLNCGLVFEENYEIFSMVKYEKLVKQREAEDRSYLMEMLKSRKEEMKKRRFI